MFLWKLARSIRLLLCPTKSVCWYVATGLLEAAGASRAEAQTVARHSVGANLTGHDSHGIIQIPTYIDRIDKGHIVPGAPMDVMSDTPTTTVVDGN